jgi:hypothetical protein
MRRTAPFLAGLLSVALLATGCDAADPTATLAPTTPPQASVPSAGQAAPDTALGLLETLPVRIPAPMAGFSRDLFGPAWADVDHNGCDTRNDILRRDLAGVTYRPNTHDCVIVSGTLADPYSNSTINFTKSDASAVQIDHVVALSDAWKTGAQTMTPDQRLALANDPLNLLAVDGPLNNAKGDDDPSQWLPPNVSYRCAYVARVVTVKSVHGLWVTPDEHDAIAQQLSACPDQPLATPLSR